MNNYNSYDLNFKKKASGIEPDTSLPPNKFMTNPPINEPIIPVAIFLNRTIHAFLSIIILPTHPAKGPNISQDKIPIDDAFV